MWSEPELGKTAMFESNEPRATFGERGMGFAGYPASQGWAFISGPGGSRDHRWNAPGPDGIAFKTRGRLKIHILDNKAYSRPGSVYGASALSPQSLVRNLGALVQRIVDPRFDSVPRIHQLRTYLRGTVTALQGGQPLPSRVKLLITNFGGRSSDVSPALRRRGIVFRNLAP